MITRESIAALDPALLDSLEDLYLARLEIDLPRWEAIGVVHWSYIELFENSTHFWRRSQAGLQNFDGNLAMCFEMPIETFSYSQLTEEAALHVLRDCLDGNPLFDATLKDLGPFCGGTSLYDDWDIKIAVSQFGRLYFAAYWETYA